MSDFKCNGCGVDFNIGSAAEEKLCHEAIRLDKTNKRKKKRKNKEFVVIICKHCSKEHFFPDDFEVYSEENIVTALK